MAFPSLKRFSSDWSSSRFSRRSTDHTCQPGVSDTIHWARGTKYALPAEVPGSRTSTFLAALGPILRTPTLLYCAGVPGAAKLGIQVTESGSVVAAFARGEYGAPTAPAAVRRAARETAAAPASSALDELFRSLDTWHTPRPVLTMMVNVRHRPGTVLNQGHKSGAARRRFSLVPASARTESWLLAMGSPSPLPYAVHRCAPS